MMRLTGPLAILLSTAFTAPLWAAGILPYEIGTPEVGTAAAGWSARAQDAGTAFTNPAGMTRLDRSQWLLGVQPLYGNVRFHTDEATYGGNNGGNAVGWLLSGGLYGVYSVTPDIKLGYASAAYFGGPLNYNDNWAGRYFTQTSILQAVNFSFPVAMRVNDWLSLGAGLNIVYGTLEAKTAINTPGLPRDGRIKLKDDDVGYGGNFGILIEPRADTRFGLQYLTKIDLDFSDRPRLNGLNARLENRLRNAGLLNGSVDFGVTLPQMVMFSAYHDVTEQLAILGNIGWQDWSEFGKVSVGLSSFDNPSFTTNGHYQDTWHAALGLQYRLSQPWLLTTGVAYDSSPVNNKDRTVSFPEDRQIRIGLGAQYQWNNDITLGLAYEYENLGQSEIRQSGRPLKGDLSGEYSDNAIHYFLFNFIQRF